MEKIYISGTSNSSSQQSYFFFFFLVISRQKNKCEKNNLQVPTKQEISEYAQNIVFCMSILHFDQRIYMSLVQSMYSDWQTCISMIKCYKPNPSVNSFKTSSTVQKQ